MLENSTGITSNKGRKRPPVIFPTNEKNVQLKSVSQRGVLRKMRGNFSILFFRPCLPHFQNINSLSDVKQDDYYISI